MRIPLPRIQKIFSALRSFGDRIGKGIVDGWDFHFSAQHGRLIRDGNIHIEIEPLAAENFARFNRKHDDQVARLSAVSRRLAEPALFHVTAVVRPGGDIDCNFRRRPNEPLPLAVGALFEDLFPRSAAFVALTDVHRTENSVVVDILHLSASAAFLTGFIGSPAFCPRPFTRLTGSVPAVSNFSLRAFRRVQKAQFQLQRDILAARLCGSGSAAAAAGERTENVAENIFKPAEPTGRPASAEAAESAEPACIGMFQLEIVLLALFLVRKHFVRFVDFFEFSGASGIVRMQIGMIVFDQFPVGFF